METIEILGLVAASLTTTSFVPQVYKAYKYKSTKDVSLSMYMVLLVGLLLWIVYGVYIQSLAIILANVVTSILVLSILLLKLKYK